jgi:hypothetical protein
MQTRNCHEQAYELAHFSPSQKARLAELWQEWKRRRSSMDPAFQKAISCLQELPMLADLPSDAVCYIGAIASGSLKVQADAGSENAPRRGLPGAPELRVARGLVGEGSVHVSHACLALKQLREVQEDELKLQNDFFLMLSVPSAVIDSAAHCRLYALRFDIPRANVDHLYFCRAAADEEQHGRLFRNLYPVHRRDPIA